MTTEGKPQTEMPGAEVSDMMTMLAAALEGRMRRIAEEVVREQATTATGGVKVKTAAGMLDMTEWRVRQLIREGRLEVVHPTPNTLRIPVDSIRRFLHEES